MNAHDLIKKLNLTPLEIEGGYFNETYRSTETITLHDGQIRNLCTAIYYLLTPDTISRMHMVPGEEIFHFYGGDPVEMLILFEDGKGETVIMGNKIDQGMVPQVIVPGGTWQGARLVPGGEYALLGTTMSPGFDYLDYRNGDPTELIASYPSFGDLISLLSQR